MPRLRLPPRRVHLRPHQLKRRLNPPLLLHQYQHLLKRRRLKLLLLLPLLVSVMRERL